MIDYDAVNHRIQAFDKRNGGSPVLFYEWFYYANGAVREYEPLGALIDPPADEYERRCNIVRFHAARLAQAVREFDNCKEQLMMSACPDGEGVSRLQRLQTLVGQRKQELDDAQAALAATRRGRSMQRAREQDMENRRRLEEFKGTVRALRI